MQPMQTSKFNVRTVSLLLNVYTYLFVSDTSLFQKLVFVFYLSLPIVLAVTIKNLLQNTMQSYSTKEQKKTLLNINDTSQRGKKIHSMLIFRLTN
jgi:uncharacterized paraquat-inducible protein A